MTRLSCRQTFEPVELQLQAHVLPLHLQALFLPVQLQADLADVHTVQLQADLAVVVAMARVQHRHSGPLQHLHPWQGYNLAVVVAKQWQWQQHHPGQLQADFPLQHLHSGQLQAHR